MSELLKTTDYSGFYTTLNQVRTKHGARAITAHTVSANSPATASQMATLQSSINQVKTTTDSHVTAASINTTIPGVAKNDRILLSTKSTINTILSELLAVCHYNPCTSCHSSCDHDPDYPYGEPNRAHDSHGSDCILTG